MTGSLAPFTPGYPVDERRPEDVARQQASYFGDVEFTAARVVARLTGKRVVLQDNGSKPSMPDLRIESRPGPAAYGEIWIDVDQEEARTMSELFRRQRGLPAELRAPELQRIWHVSVSKATRFKSARRSSAAASEQPNVERDLRPLLGDMEAAGETFPRIATREQLVALDNQCARRLLDLGIVGAASRPIGAGERGHVLLLPGPIFCPPDLSWQQVNAWIDAKFADPSPNLRKHFAKLEATGATERHLVMGVTASGSNETYWMLTQPSGLPPEAPSLPPSVTHLWLFDAPRPHRVLVWFPDKGWLDAIENWATA